MSVDNFLDLKPIAEPSDLSLRPPAGSFCFVDPCSAGRDVSLSAVVLEKERLGLSS